MMFSCVRTDQAPVELHLKGCNGRKLAFYEITAQDGAVFLDSIIPNTRGEARLFPPDDGEGMYSLHTQTANGLVLLIEKEEKIVLTADFDSLLETLTVGCPNSGEKQESPETDSDCPAAMAVRYQQYLAQAENRIGQINRTWMENRYRIANPDSLHQDCIEQIDSLLNQAKMLAEDLCRKNTATLLPVLIANKQLGGHNVFDPENPRDLGFLLSCARDMKQKKPGNPHVERFLFNLESIDNYRKKQELDRWEKNRGKIPE